MIANQKPSELEEFRTKSEISFPFLSDDGAAVIKEWGVVNEERKALPHPATFVLDENGVVIYRAVNPDYKQRPNVGGLLRLLRQR